MKTSPFELLNIRLFVAFRCLLNARFYYPVFTILFLDYGLTIEQFSFLNTVWAITIVCAEVPSGALADLIGRRSLVITTSVLMIIEMAIIAFIPLGNGTLIFWAFFCNRVLSGLAEAMASGADEAIAYDTLVEQGLTDTWSQVLSVQYRFQSIVGVVTLTLGSILYSSKSMNAIVDFCGFDIVLNQQKTMRFPLYATLVLAFMAFYTTLRMREVSLNNEETESDNNISIVTAFARTFAAGRWILQTPFALMIILFGLCYDHILRLIATFTSQYFRCTDLPDASFGVIGATMSLLGVFTPKIAEKMCERNSPYTNMICVSVLSVVTLLGLAGFFHWFGILFVGLSFITLTLISFFVSNYLNIMADSHQRATVLSFKGMAFNIAYGAIGFFFALFLAHLRSSISAHNPEYIEKMIENSAFTIGVGSLSLYVIAITLLLYLTGKILLRGRTEHLHPMRDRAGGIGVKS